MRTTSTLLAKSLGLLSVAGLAVALGACGGDPAAAEGDADAKADAARVRLQQCLRKNGLNVQSRDGGRSTIVRVDRAKAEAAMQKCRKFQQEAFGSITPEQRQEFEDAATKFAACMREHGVDMPDPTVGGGPGARPGPATRGLRIDRESPKTQAAMKACQDKLPDTGRGPGGGGVGFRAGGPPGAR